jgi:hypothetical protein
MYRIHQPFYNARIESMSRERNNSLYVNNSDIINNVSQRNLAKVLIEFMNLQTKDVRTMISQELCKHSNRIICDILRDPPHYYISQGINEGYLTFSKFMQVMEHVKNEGFHLKGFTNIVENYKSLPENSNERKQNKYKGMINCCIVNGECQDSREVRNTFLGIPIGRPKTPRLCTISGGRRKKRRTRLTKKYRR